MTKKSWGRLIVIVAPLVMLVIVLFQNIKAAPVALLFWEIEMSKSLLLILTFLAGGTPAHGLQRLDPVLDTSYGTEKPLAGDSEGRAPCAGTAANVNH